MSGPWKTRYIQGRVLAVFAESLNYIDRVLLFLRKSGASFAMVTWSEEVERKQNRQLAS